MKSFPIRNDYIMYKYMFIINHIDMYRNVFTYMNVLYVVNLKVCVLIHELPFNMYIYFTYIITINFKNNLIHKQHVTYILKIIETI